MTNTFSFIILTLNEEQHLPRLLNSIKELNAPVFILDSGSTDNTLKIAEEFGAIVLYNKFENHPKQWDFALKNFDIKQPSKLLVVILQSLLRKEKLKNSFIHV